MMPESEFFMRKAALIGFLIVLAGLFTGCGPKEDREFRRGLRELRRGEAVRARTLLESALTQRPGHEANASIQNAVGIACWRTGDIAAARRAFEEGRRLDPNFMDPTCNLGLLQAHQGDLPRAVALLEEAALIDPKRTEALEFLAGIHENEKRWAEAVRTLAEALERQPDSPRILTARAFPMLQQGDPGAAVKTLLQALDQKADYPPALYNLALLHGDTLSDPVQAAGYARRFLREVRQGARADILRSRLEIWTPVLRPAAPRAHPVPPAEIRPTGGILTNSPLDIARLQAARGRAVEALDLCLKEAEQARAVGDTPRRERALRTAIELGFDQADAQLAYGMFLEEQRRWSSAIRSYQKALALAPASAVAAASLARVAVAGQEYDTALLTLRRAVEDHPQQADFLWQLARLMDEFVKKGPEAARQYRLFVSKFPQDPRTSTALQRLRALTGEVPVRPIPKPVPSQIVEAAVPSVLTPPKPAPQARSPRRIEWQRSTRKNPQAAQQAIQRGLAHQKQGDPERAAYYFLRALENDEHQITAFYYLAEIYRQRGDLDLAQDAYQQAIEIGPDTADVRFNLATVYHARGESSAALEELQRALSMKKEFPPALYLSGLILSADPQRQVEARAYFSRFLSVASKADPLVAPVRDWLRLPSLPAR